MAFEPVTEDDLAPLPPGFAAVTEADLAPAAGAAPSGNFVPRSFGEAAQQAKTVFGGIGRGLSAANDFAARALAHPIDTARQIAAAPGASFRTAMRGVNANIPFANQAVQAAGGPVAESPEDTAAAPAGLGEFTGLAAAPGVGKLVGGIAAKGIEAAAPAVSRAVRSIGQSAEERNVARTLEELGQGANKRARGGLNQGTVAQAVRDEPALAKAAGHDEKLLKLTEQMKKRAGGELETIYAKAPPTRLKPLLGEKRPTAAPAAFDAATSEETTIASPGRPAPPPDVHPDLVGAASALDKRISELGTGDVNQRVVSAKLQKIRDEMIDSLGKRKDLTLRQLRDEQSAYQRNGYAKNIADDPEVGANIAANREASKAVGDAVIRRVTGMDYAEARAFAKNNPKSLAARLLKANDTVSAANRIEAAVADRAGKVQPRSGLPGKLLDVAKEIKHSPSGFVLSKVPAMAAKGLIAADRAVSATARGVLGGSSNKIASLVRMARQGAAPAAIAAQGHQWKLPPELVARVAATAKAPAAPPDDGDIVL